MMGFRKAGPDFAIHFPARHFTHLASEMIPPDTVLNRQLILFTSQMLAHGLTIDGVRVILLAIALA